MEAASPDLSFQGSRPARHTGRAQGARRRWLCAGVRVECELTRREGRRALLLAIAVAVRRRVDLWPSGWWLAHAGRADRARPRGPIAQARTCSDLRREKQRGGSWSYSCEANSVVWPSHIQHTTWLSPHPWLGLGLVGGRIWIKKLVKFDQIRSNLIKFGQIRSNLIKFGQIRSN